MVEFMTLAEQCAPAVHPTTMAAVVRVESSFNPYAIGVVAGRLERQPRTKAEAVATAKSLEAAGFNFSVGVGQVNRYNLAKYGLSYDSAFEPCHNLRAASLILKECYDRASRKGLNAQDALQASFSCYYSGNFSTGFRPDFRGQPSYVQKVLNSAGSADRAIAVTPARAVAVKRPASPRVRPDAAFKVTEQLERAGPVLAAGSASVEGSVMVFR